MLKTTLILSLFFGFYTFADNLDDKKPQDIDESMWVSFKSAYHATILSPTPNGLGEAGALLGSSVAIDGNRALIGSPNLLNTGAAIVLEFDGLNWNQTAVLQPLTFYFSGFGSSVSLSGDIAVVGNHTDSEAGSQAGAAHIYKWDGVEWLETKLIASDSSEFQGFGYSVNIDNNRVVVGALYGHQNDNYTGSAYIYEFDGNDWIETKISPSDGAMFDLFGSSVDIDGDRILVGSKEDRINNIQTGSAYVFDWDGNNWQETKLTASDGADFDYFGASVSLEGDVALVSAPNDDDNGEDSGALYIYQWDGMNWLESKLLASDGMPGDSFGDAYIKDNRIIVAAPGDDDNGNNSGAIYFYEWNNGWIETKITASDGSQTDNFGRSLAFWGDFIFVGAPRDDEGLVNSGSTYIYHWNSNSWDETKYFLAEGSAYDQFGYSISYSNNRVLVGAPFDHENGITSGSVYIFEWDGQDWNDTKIIPSLAEDFSQFGYAVSIDGDRAVVGVLYGNGGQSYSGSVYVYDWDGQNWLETEITASDANSSDNFGSSISLKGDRLLVGSPYNADLGPNSGSAYIFDWDGSNWLETKITASDGSADDTFGQAVSLFGDMALIGSPRAASIGAVYLFQWDGINWMETKIEPTDLNAGQFGHAVSLNNNRFLVGAPFGFDNGNYFGAAYIYDWDGQNWIETKIIPNNISLYNEFGTSVSLDNNKAVIGNPIGTNYTGSAYVYQWNGNTWDETILMSNTPTEYNGFGKAVFASDGMVFIGANQAKNNLSQTGLAYIYQLPDLIFANGFEVN